MNFDLSSAALLFPAVSLLLLAYTNRFLALAKLIRDLYQRYQESHEPVLVSQIQHLRLRLILIRSMQALGVTSLLVCVGCMFLLLQGQQEPAVIGFKCALILLALSLALSVWEIQISSNALNIQLGGLLKKGKRKALILKQKKSENKFT